MKPSILGQVPRPVQRLFFACRFGESPWRLHATLHDRYFRLTRQQSPALVPYSSNIRVGLAELSAFRVVMPEMGWFSRMHAPADRK